MDIMIVEIFLKAFVLCGLLYLVARNEADFEFAKVAMVTAGISLGTFVVDILLQPRIGFFSIIPSIAFVVFMIMKFCWVPFWKAILVTFLYLVFNTLLAIGVILLMGKMNESAGETMTSKHDADLQEARQMVHEMYNMPAPPPPPPPADSGKPPSQAEQLIKMFKQFFPAPGEKPGTTPVPAPAPVPITVVPAVTAAAPAVASVPALRPAPPVAVTAAPPRAVEKAPAPPPARSGGFKAMLQGMSGRGGEKKGLATADAPGWDSARAKINVSAVMTGEGDSRVAVVNGQMIEEGTYYTLEHERLTYRWLLKEVQRGRVVWEPAPGEPAVAK